jgi:low affinity Fe/Cu permease
MGIEKQLSREQLAVGHNRSLKNIEAKLKALVVDYHETKEHNLESIKKLTGLEEEAIVDTISRYETRKSRNTIVKSVEQQAPTKQEKGNDMKDVLEVLKDIQTMMRYLITKVG